MGLILSLETSTQVCSVALHDKGQLLVTSEVHVEHSHASKLAVLVEQVLMIAGTKPDQLNAVAISSGPGSYTGLRIGASTAKGLCYGLDIPLISVGTLELMAFQMHSYNLTQSFLCPMIDARRMEVYCLLTDAQLNVVCPVASKVINILSFSELLDKNRIIFFGNGALKCKTVITDTNATFIDGVHPKASSLGELAYDYLARNIVADVSQFVPQYFKDFKAKKSKTFI